MSKEAELFYRVFYKMVDTFTPQFQLFIRILEEETPENDPEKQFQFMAKKMRPSLLKTYQNSVQSVGKLAHAVPDIIIEYLVDLYTTLLIKGEPSLYAVLLQSSQFMRSIGELSKQLCLIFGIYMTTDLLLYIVQNFGICGKNALLADAAYKICSTDLNISIPVEIINSWSSILAFLSMDNFPVASSNFFNLIDKCDNDKLFILISKLRLDASVDIGIKFLENLIPIIRTFQRKDN